MKTLNRFMGNRLPDTKLWQLPDGFTKIGSYWKVLDNDGSPLISSELSNLTKDIWRIVVPMDDGTEYGIGNLIAHTVRENEDGTISVLPGDGSSNSILITGSHGKQWHGYIYNGEFREIG